MNDDVNAGEIAGISDGIVGCRGRQTRVWVYMGSVV